MRAGGLLGELWKTVPGKLGLILLGILVLGSVVVVATYPPNFGPARWSNPALWADYPRSAPPVWVNLFSRERRLAHRLLQLSSPTEVSSSNAGTVAHYRMGFSLATGQIPTFLSFSVSDIRFQSQPPVITATLLRPDGGSITLHREVVSGPRSDESPPYRRNAEDPLRVVVDSDDTSLDELVALYADRYGTSVDRSDVQDQFGVMLFSKPAAGGFQTLTGAYVLEVQLLEADPQDRAGSVRMVAGGAVFGAMGTDALGRDLAQGLLFGLPIALLIGISTAVVGTLIGMGLGLASGYFGGTTDTVIQRAADIVANVPLLPLLIFLVFIGGSRLWLILLVLVLFSWPGLTITVRTMVLQLRTGAEVEAAQALGASGRRVVVRHILPHAASFVLAQLVFSAPSAILAEAGLSFLGLGDPSLPTWGQILESGFRTGAVYLGYWWWVIPPGLAIVITAVTFMFLALGLEPVVDPRLGDDACGAPRSPGPPTPLRDDPGDRPRRGSCLVHGTDRRPGGRSDR